MLCWIHLTDRCCFVANSTSGVDGQNYLQTALPDEIVLTIISYLFEFDLCRVAQVCRRFNTIANDPEIWYDMEATLVNFSLLVNHSGHSTDTGLLILMTLCLLVIDKRQFFCHWTYQPYSTLSSITTSCTTVLFKILASVPLSLAGCSPLSPTESSLCQSTARSAVVRHVHVSNSSSQRCLSTHHQCADDTQLYYVCSTQRQCRHRLVVVLRKWAASHPSTKPKAVSRVHHKMSTDCHRIVVLFWDTVKLLGVTLDSDLMMDWHITGVLRSCNYHIRALRHIRPLLTLDAAKMITHSVVSSRLDYANALLHGTSVTNPNKLQVAQNTLARVMCQALWSFADNYTGCQSTNK